MKMGISHIGQTGKETAITFDTDRNMFCYGRRPCDVFIYAEQFRDVTGVVNGLKKIGYAEVTVEEFRK